MKRREFVKNVSIAVPTIVLAPSLLSSCKKDNDDLEPTDWAGHVIVIGAGAAGLYAGQMLTQYAPNASYQIFEASGKIGGRVRELTNFADFPIELGAEEVHGNKSRWYDIVNASQGVSFIDDSNVDDHYVIDGVLMPEMQAGSDPDMQQVLAFRDQIDSFGNLDITVEERANIENIANRVRHVLNAEIGNEWGTDNSRLGIKALVEEDELWTAGEDSYMITGRSFISIMEDEFSTAWNKVQVNTQIIKIDYSGAQVILTDQNNQTYSCDKVIITVPLAVLRSGDIDFYPSLPTSKTNAIANIGMGNGLKVIIKFSGAIAGIQGGSVFSQYNVPEYWVTSYGRGNDVVFTAFIMGQKADYLSSLNPADLDTAIRNDVQQTFGPLAAGMITSIYVMDWGKEPYIKGAYSFPMVGGGITKRQKLAEPINNTLFFAGEATHTQGHSATLHGAVETGYNAVKALIESVN